MKEFELLAPVGSKESLIAAVQSGADAIYMGGPKFSARQYANNFDNDDMVEAIDYAHLRNVKVYITINTLIKNKEMKEVIEYISFLSNAGVDGLIVQDIGLASIIHKFFPNIELHGSTQMTIHNLQGAKFLESLGFKRVVVSRETTLEEIIYIKQNSSIELEVFIHGALCLCYSGQCFMSSLIGGRSGNRGRCAQPCRMEYKMEGSGNEKKYLLSPKDLCTLENIDKLLDVGVISYKIEGRMKRPEYVAMTVSTYRKAIDSYLEKSSTTFSEGDMKNLAQVFNRGFTQGFLFDDAKNDFISLEKPNNRGIPLGKVVSYDKKSSKVTIYLEEPLGKGDGIEVWRQRGDNTGTRVDKMFVGSMEVQQAKAGQTVNFILKGEVSKNDIVYKTNDETLNKSLEHYYSGQNIRKQKLWARMEIKLGKSPNLSLGFKEGLAVEVQSYDIVQQAQKRPLTVEDVEKQLNKLGDTPFEFESLDIDLDEGVFMTISQLNNIRREAIDKFSSLIVQGYRRDEDHSLIVKEYFNWVKGSESQHLIPYISVNTHDSEIVKKAVELGVDRIYYSGIGNLPQVQGMVEGSNTKLFMALPRINTSNELDYLYKLYKKHSSILSGILMSNLGQIEAFKEENIEKLADFSLNLFNQGALKTLDQLNIDKAVPSLELNMGELREMSKNSPLLLETIVYGRVVMMVTEHCPISPTGGKHCEKCSIKCEQSIYYLEDRMGAKFPIIKDFFKRTLILNSQPLYICDTIKDVLMLNPAGIRLDFTTESPQEAEMVIKGYQDAITRAQGKNCNTDNIDRLDEYIKKQGFTRGHYYRGVE